MTRVFKGKKIVLGITGGIAAYKAADLASRLVKAGAQVDVIMTEAATKFVAPLTFQTITARPVTTEMFALLKEMEIGHVCLAEKADLVAIVPATANTIAKLAHGLADNMLTATVLATRAPVVIAPAMDAGMYENAITQDNLKLLSRRGMTIVGPDYGRLASGAIGWGRLAEAKEILDSIRIILGREEDLAGRRILVTAGGTREPIDPVRFIGNRSSGKMGYRLAEAARDRGAQVALISGPSVEAKPGGVSFFLVETAQEMAEAVNESLDTFNPEALIMAAAVADYRPASAAESKIKKGDKEFTLELERTADILSQVAPYGLFKVGFAAETDNLVENALAKLQEKGLDLIVANPVPATFGADESQATIIQRGGRVTELGLLTKAELADKILNKVLELTDG